ncbi:hypothetical protein P154DRAFT_517358 [Amniculicola lignicola CBS 123094]|uniref:Uncharacterized protein n=1 Tax=Amniculicola lignicola CBS 123094 TaxID=1392246 RepID=A0A6A5WYS0_9PLEO|nr:hypothetical protein P154DRAFT_517358 [Amniculicola lignicola CBS 123094]
MARMLGRSRSMRILRGSPKEIHQQDTDRPSPPHPVPQVELDRLKAATPVTRPENRVNTPDMLQRPKTSGGLGDRGKLFHKKVAPVMPQDSEQHGPHAFPFPSPTKSSTTTILYTAEVNEEREGVIGIALGSPTMAAHWNVTPSGTDLGTYAQGNFTQVFSNNPSHHTLPGSAGIKQEVSKPKISRWKSIFGKKNQQSQQSRTTFYQVAQTAAPATTPPPGRADSHHDEDSSIDTKAAQQSVPQAEIRSISPPTYKADIRESRKMPKGRVPPPVEKPRARTIAENSTGKPKATLTRSASSPKPPPKDGWMGSPNVPQIFLDGKSQATSPRSIGGGLLDVEIPSITMDRYSVMFSDVLKPGNRSSSLLMRRQGTDRLKPLNQLSVKKDEEESQNGTLKPQRRATSPSFPPPKSPNVTLSLFPQTNRESRTPSPRAVSINRSRPLQRSKTAPASSPNRATFKASKSLNSDVKEVSQDSRSLGQKEKEDPSKESPLPTPTPNSRLSFESDADSVTIVVGRTSDVPWKPRVEEPQWEIVNKKPTRQPSQRSDLNPLFSNPVVPSPSQLEHPSSAPLESRVNGMSKAGIEPAPRSADRVVSPRQNNATMVGVARSVSVSRAKRPEFLKPTGLVRSATSSERLVDRRALTPTLVELKNRRSERVQLVDV